VPYESLGEKDGRKFVGLEDIKKAEREEMKSGCAILVGTGFGRKWFDKNYMANSPFFKKDAFDYLLDKNPLLISADFPAWENTVNLEGFLPRLYSSGVFVLVSVVNLEQIKSFKVRLTALPIKVIGVCMCPARAVIIED